MILGREQPQKCILLGATGSIGESSLRVVRKHPDKLSLLGASLILRGQTACHRQEFQISNLHLSVPTKRTIPI